MSFINYASREINCKIVYYGPGLCGKTTNLQYIYAKTNPEAKGKMISLATETERTLFFDFLPLALGEDGEVLEGEGVAHRAGLDPGEIEEVGDHPGEPLGALHVLAERYFGEHDYPERHGVDEHCGLACSAAHESPHGKADKTRRLKQAEPGETRGFDRPQRPAKHGQNGKQACCGDPGAQGGESKRAGVVQGDFHDHPVISPDQG